MLRIVADTTSGLTPQHARQYGFDLLPQLVIFGEQTFRDDTELDTATFLSKLRSSSQLPKTAAPPHLLYHPIFEDARQKGQTVLVVAPSGKISGTIRSVETAAQDFPDLPIHIVDTQTVAGNLATLVLLAAQLAAEGLSAEESLARLKALLPRQRLYFLVDTLEYLKKGGRIGGAKALLGELLQVKPILQLKDGQVEPLEQTRTKRRALSRLVELVAGQAPAGKAHLSVMQIDAEEQAQALAQEIAARLNIPTPPVYRLPAAIGVHAGPGALAVGFFA
ncbi:MAG: DegV family protein [Anaerolineales bacterium]